MTKTELARITTDDLWPRTPEFRYRLYAVDDGQLRVLGAAPDPEALGVMLVTLHQDAKAHGGCLGQHGRVGILDVVPTVGSTVGEWIVFPW